MFGFGKRRVEKLDFLVAGAQKSGTTALNYYLKRHPRIALPVKKELHFFDNDELFAAHKRRCRRQTIRRCRKNAALSLPFRLRKSCIFSTTTNCLPAATSLMSRSMKCFDRRAPVVSRARIARFIFIGGRLCRESGITTRR